MQYNLSYTIKIIVIIGMPPPYDDKTSSFFLIQMIPRRPVPTFINEGKHSDEIKQLLSHCLCKDPNERFIADRLLEEPFVKSAPSATQVLEPIGLELIKRSFSGKQRTKKKSHKSKTSDAKKSSYEQEKEKQRGQSADAVRHRGTHRTKQTEPDSTEKFLLQLSAKDDEQNIKEDTDEERTSSKHKEKHTETIESHEEDEETQTFIISDSSANGEKAETVEYTRSTNSGVSFVFGQSSNLRLGSLGQKEAAAQLEEGSASLLFMNEFTKINTALESLQTSVNNLSTKVESLSNIVLRQHYGIEKDCHQFISDQTIRLGE